MSSITLAFLIPSLGQVRALPYQHLHRPLGHRCFCRSGGGSACFCPGRGELARLALAMISIAAIDLLILDEPSNWYIL
ncbi:hypothetical protein [Leptolyngbya sp. KIOST-1]|uniref:hypothetical protein n=1 Tax=Leptolyngbya sp. KIOST-1 TaxID=1229172 RepID=UPI00056C3081|nr:hypothetical protein [Leptolyngbya sp. KIOST-1]